MDSIAYRLTIVRPTLKYLDLWSQEAENLIVGTAMVESNLRHIKQINGPALSLIQMEPATHDDIWDNFLAYRDELRGKVEKLVISSLSDLDNLKYNQVYAVAMARVHYLRDSKPIPKTYKGLANYHKRVYNTHLGKTDVSKSVKYFKQAVKEAKQWKPSSNTLNKQAHGEESQQSLQVSDSTLRPNLLMRLLSRLVA